MNENLQTAIELVITSLNTQDNRTAILQEKIANLEIRVGVLTKDKENLERELQKFQAIKKLMSG